MLKGQKGVTLVALVVTIVVLIILAGVSISLVIGNNGAATKAQQAQELTANAAVYENAQFINLEHYINEL